jgi:hypothetical protein
VTRAAVEGLLRLLKPDGGEVVLGEEELAVADMLGIPVRKEKSKIRVRPKTTIKNEPLGGDSEAEEESQEKDVYKETDKLFARRNSLENNAKPDSAIEENGSVERTNKGFEEELEDITEAEPEDAIENPLERSAHYNIKTEKNTSLSESELTAEVAGAGTGEQMVVGAVVGGTARCPECTFETAGGGWEEVALHVAEVLCGAVFS